MSLHNPLKPGVKLHRNLLFDVFLTWFWGNWLCHKLPLFYPTYAIIWIRNLSLSYASSYPIKEDVTYDIQPYCEMTTFAWISRVLDVENVWREIPYQCWYLKRQSIMYLCTQLFRMSMVTTRDGYRDGRWVPIRNPIQNYKLIIEILCRDLCYPTDSVKPQFCIFHYRSVVVVCENFDLIWTPFSNSYFRRIEYWAR